jgi:hypothetical protein
MTVVTINKVQDIYKTPVYGFKAEDGKEIDDEAELLETLNTYLEQRKHMDLNNYYAKTQFNAVHIGDFVLSGAQEEEVKEPLVSVVMPVYNTPKAFL